MEGERPGVRPDPGSRVEGPPRIASHRVLVERLDPALDSIADPCAVTGDPPRHGPVAPLLGRAARALGLGGRGRRSPPDGSRAPANGRKGSPASMTSHTIKVTGLSAELLRLLDE